MKNLDHKTCSGSDNFLSPKLLSTVQRKKNKNEVVPLKKQRS